MYNISFIIAFHVDVEFSNAQVLMIIIVWYKYILSELLDLTNSVLFAQGVKLFLEQGNIKKESCVIVCLGNSTSAFIDFLIKERKFNLVM